MTKDSIKQKVYDSCPFDHRCEKNGGVLWSEMQAIDGNRAKIVPCPCSLQADKYYQYAEAGIEQEYWDFTIDKIDKEFDKSILENYVNVFKDKVDACIKNKIALWFWGNTGSGTTTIAIIMLKIALDAGFNGKIIPAREIISILYSKNRDISELNEYDFLIIDGVDRINNNVAKNFSITMSEIMDKKATIFTSLIPATDLNDNYYIDFRDRATSIPNVKFKPINFRKKYESRFEAIKNMEVKK